MGWRNIATRVAVPIHITSQHDERNEKEEVNSFETVT